MLNKTTREDFLTPAFMAEVKDLLPDWGAVPYYNNIIWVEKNNKKTLVGVCSDIYGFISTLDIFPKIEELLKGKYEFEATYKQQDYNKYYVDYVFKGLDLFIGNKNDLIKPTIKIVHSYNGQLKYTILFGFYRQICTNGLYGFAKKSQFDYKHTIKNVDKIINDSLNEIENFLGEVEMEGIKRAYEVLDNKECFYPDRVKEILKIIPLFPKKAIVSVNDILQEENLKGEITDWIVYNTFNQVLNNYQNKLYEEEILKIDNKIFEYLYNN
jgi:hypothetical protein